MHALKPEELGEHVDRLHGVLVLLVEDKVAEVATAFGPGVFSGSFRREKTVVRKPFLHGE